MIGPIPFGGWVSLVKKSLSLVILIAAFWSPGLHAADFEIGPADSGSGSAPAADSGSHHEAAAAGMPASDVPTPILAGDVPTAYGLRKYEMRTDFSFYEGGGILGKAYLGLFPQFFIGGAANVRGFIGSSDLKMERDDAQLLAKLVALKEDDSLPGVAIGWDGPAYDRGLAKGLYVALSKEVPTPLGFVQFHGGVNSSNIESFVGSRDLRASAAMTAAVKNFGFFTGVDEVLDPVAPRWSLGLSGYFEPITLGIEWHDLASGRPATNSTRLLKVSWVGRF